MRAILIDPKAETVTEIDCPCEGDYKAISRAIEADLFTVVTLNEHRDSVFVDDEGLLNDPEHFFLWRGYEQPLAGRGLILGTNDEGDSTPPKMTLEDARDHVSFTRLTMLGFVTEEGTIDHPLLGPGTFTIKHTPVFGPPRASVWDEGDDGQDRESYSDEQDRESYKAREDES